MVEFRGLPSTVTSEVCLNCLPLIKISPDMGWPELSVEAQLHFWVKPRPIRSRKERCWATLGADVGEFEPGVVVDEAVGPQAERINEERMMTKNGLFITQLYIKYNRA